MSKIIHVVGGMAAGKTTLIKRFLAQGKLETLTSKKGRVLGLFLTIDGCDPIFVPGNYADKLQSSGCDTLKNVIESYEIIMDAWHDGYSVVYEGLYMMNHTRGPELYRKTRCLTVLQLTTPIDVCMEGIVERRRAQGNMDTTRPKHIDQQMTRARNYAFKMAQAGAKVIKITREDGLKQLLHTIGG